MNLMINIVTFNINVSLTSDYIRGAIMFFGHDSIAPSCRIMVEIRFRHHSGTKKRPPKLCLTIFTESLHRTSFIDFRPDNATGRVQSFLIGFSIVTIVSFPADISEVVRPTAKMTSEPGSVDDGRLPDEVM